MHRFVPGSIQNPHLLKPYPFRLCDGRWGASFRLEPSSQGFQSAQILRCVETEKIPTLVLVLVHHQVILLACLWGRYRHKIYCHALLPVSSAGVNYYCFLGITMFHWQRQRHVMWCRRVFVLPSHDAWSFCFRTLLWWVHDSRQYQAIDLEWVSGSHSTRLIFALIWSWLVTGWHLWFLTVQLGWVWNQLQDLHTYFSADLCELLFLSRLAMVINLFF
jgi:hypothetical protein